MCVTMRAGEAPDPASLSAVVHFRRRLFCQQPYQSQGLGCSRDPHCTVMSRSGPKRTVRRTPSPGPVSHGPCGSLCTLPFRSNPKPTPYASCHPCIGCRSTHSCIQSDSHVHRLHRQPAFILHPPRSAPLPTSHSLSCSHPCHLHCTCQ